MDNETGERGPKFSLPVIPIIILLVLAALFGCATLIPAYDCEACNGTGWNQGFFGIGHSRGKCYICSGTLRITSWSHHFGAHARFMRPHR